MRSSPFVTLIHRPVATSMFFLALVLLGLFAMYRIPPQLLPPLSGESLYVRFTRPGSPPDVIEREILLPLEARAGELTGLAETRGEVRGEQGSLQLQFEKGSNYRVRELELRQIAAELNRSQPQGTFINVSSQDFSALSRFVMVIQVLGGDDRNALRDLVDERIQQRISSLPGISQVWVNGGAPREVTVWVDPDKCAALGVRPAQVTQALGRSVRRLRYLGGAEQPNRRMEVILDGRPAGIKSLGEIRLSPDSPVLLRHVADIEMTTARQQSMFRVNGKAAVGLIVFQDEGANLVQLGRALRSRLDDLRREFNPYGIDFKIGFDAAQTVEDQLDRLKQLAGWGFLIALVVLYLFLREFRAVAVVAIAVPVSLLVAFALLYLGGYTLNIITLFGLAIGIGMLVDNSIVVFEAVQRSLERGLDPDTAAVSGIQRTVRAIIVASVTNAIVFLPAIYLVDDSLIQEMLIQVAVAILLPLFASLLVAIGLVPLLAQRLAAPAALVRLQRIEQRRRAYGGNVPPQRTRELFSALLKVVLRRPAPWLATITIAVVLTIIIAMPWVLLSTLTQEAQQADQVQQQIEIKGGSSLAAAGTVFERVEQADLDMKGIAMVESSFQEDGGTLTVHLDTNNENSDTTAGKVRKEIRNAVKGLDNVELKSVSIDNGSGGSSNDSNGGGGLFGTPASQVLISGPDMGQLKQLANEIRERLEAVPEISNAWVSGSEGQEELQVRTVPAALTTYRLQPQDVLTALNIFRREGVELQVGFTLADGRELPLTVRRPQVISSSALLMIDNLRLANEQGAIPLGAVARGHKVLPPPVISHHNGRRELTVNYRLGDEAPQVGPPRLELEQHIQDIVRTAYRPTGYTVEAQAPEQASDWFKKILVPVLLMLYAVLAIAFESMTMPLLILLAIPSAVFGAVWALVMSGQGADIYALVGVIALLGLTVNPAILLVDRMQKRLLNTGCSGGTAAINAVRERTRPVLMTTATTIAGLWPLAISTGGEYEVWPPFATVVIGGLLTSTLLTLLVIPVGFVFFAWLDRIFGRLGPWVLMGWAAATAAVISPLILTGQLNAFNWQIATTILVAGIFLWLAVQIFRRQPQIQVDDQETSIETRYLSKVYGRPGPIAKAWHEGIAFSKRFITRSRGDAGERAFTFCVLFLGAAYLAYNLQLMIWQLLFFYIATAFFSRTIIELHGFTRLAGDAGMPVAAVGTEADLVRKKARFDGFIRLLSPWLLLAFLFVHFTMLPLQAQEPVRLFPAEIILLGLATLFVQAGRRTAVRTLDNPMIGGMDEIEAGRIKTFWRRFCLKVFGFDLPGVQIQALDTVSFRADKGMIGILGPNGAGKTTLLRMLAGVLDPTLGTVHYRGFLKRNVAHYVSRWIGYLPQEFGLPDHLTAREYLDYYALLYEVGNKEERRQRVDDLLRAVGLGDRMNEKISGYSGGMRQRVAVARTLLRQPPIIIVDEPTVGLDPRERIRFRNLLSRLAEGRVILFSTHVVEDVAVSCQRVIVFSKGRICYDGQPGELAQLAAGKAWEVRLPAGESATMVEGSKIVDQVPEADGGVRMRVLSRSQPHANARLIEPLIEDGYLSLVGD